jgi:hypothetical protein
MTDNTEIIIDHFKKLFGTPNLHDYYIKWINNNAENEEFLQYKQHINNMNAMWESAYYGMLKSPVWTRDDGEKFADYYYDPDEHDVVEELKKVGFSDERAEYLGNQVTDRLINPNDWTWQHQPSIHYWALQWAPQMI